MRREEPIWAVSWNSKTDVHSWTWITSVIQDRAILRQMVGSAWSDRLFVTSAGLGEPRRAEEVIRLIVETGPTKFSATPVRGRRTIRRGSERLWRPRACRRGSRNCPSLSKSSDRAQLAATRRHGLRLRGVDQVPSGAEARRNTAGWLWASVAKPH